MERVLLWEAPHGIRGRKERTPVTKMMVQGTHGEGFHSKKPLTASSTLGGRVMDDGGWWRLHSDIGREGGRLLFLPSFVFSSLDCMGGFEWPNS